MVAEDHNLRLIAIFHYVVSGLAAVFSLFPILYVVLGLMMILGKLNDGSNPPPAFFGWFIMMMGLCFMLAGLAFAGCYAYAGRSLARRKHYTYCLVMAAIGCMFWPFGTALGVFTIVALQKDTVRQEFAPPTA